MTHRHSRFGWGLVAIALSASFGCKEEVGLGPGTSIEVSNVVDEFRWQLTATSAVTETLNYVWTTTGPLVDVVQSGNVLSGSGTVVVRDANGTEVYSRSLAEAGTFQTASGVVGQWTVVVDMNNMTAVTNFSLSTP